MAPEFLASGFADPFVYSSAQDTLTVRRGADRFRPLAASADGTAADAEAALRGARRAGWRDPRIVGALPFRSGAPAALMVAETARTTGGGSGYGATPPGPDRGRRPRVREQPSRDDYADLVERAIHRLARTELEKVVLARTLLLDAERPIDPGRVLHRLGAADPGARIFSVAAGEADDHYAGSLLVGASPELLVARRGEAVESHPLAGSAPRDPDPARDRDRARHLAASAKDRREHAFVVDAIAERLRPLCSRLDIPATPAVTATAAMWHLGTPITGVLRRPRPSALELALALHPTPAVCGTPARAAAEAIAELEPVDRGLYAGAVGWCDADGDGEWAVTLRCAEIAGSRARLFAGAGIVADSAAPAEAAETGAKFRTMLDALAPGAADHGSA